jgi:hypothetical protein
MKVRIIFDREKLEETVMMLRALSGETGPVIEAESAGSNIEEVLRLSEIVKLSLQSGEFFNINSTVRVAEGTCETLVVLEPTQRLREHFAAVGIAAQEV